MVNIYFTKKKIKGIDGLKNYYVTSKADIKYLGGRNSKSTTLNKEQFKKTYKELTGNIPLIKLV
jgi:hypothetical protein